MYAEFGFGLWAVELADGTAIGICGLLKRPVLDDVDLGFAMLPQFRRAGYAFEAASAVVAHARDTLRLEGWLRSPIPITTRPAICSRSSDSRSSRRP